MSILDIDIQIYLSSYTMSIKFIWLLQRKHVAQIEKHQDRESDIICITNLSTISYLHQDQYL